MQYRSVICISEQRGIYKAADRAFVFPGDNDSFSPSSLSSEFESQFPHDCPVKSADIPLKRASSYGRTRHLSSPGLHRRGHQGGPAAEIQGGFSFIHCQCVKDAQSRSLFM